MSIIVEQPLPITFLILSRVSTYAHCVESAVATFVFWACPSLCPGMPPRQILKKRRTILCRTISVHSLDSSSTLVEELAAIQNNATVSLDDQPNPSTRQKLGNALVKFSAPIMAPSHSIRPFARRMSLPARRLSESFATAVATPFRTHTCDIDPPSYFTTTVEPSTLSPEEPIIQEVPAIERENAPEAVVCIVQEKETAVLLVKRTNKIKRVTRKMKSLLHFRQRSTSLLST